MIKVLAMVVGSGATMKEFMSVMAVHPTVGEEIVAMQTPTVLYDRRRNVSTPLVRSAAVCAAAACSEGLLGKPRVVEQLKS
jgi:glutathione reductase (NADPH)